jgi:hypothetical protein
VVGGGAHSSYVYVSKWMNESGRQFLELVEQHGEESNLLI